MSPRSPVPLEEILKRSGVSIPLSMLRSPKNKAILKRMIASELRAAQARQQASEAEREYERVRGERASHAEELRRCREGWKGDSGVVYWINNWCWAYDPRLLNKKPDPTDKDRAGAYTRFRLRPKQRECLVWLEAREAANEQGLADKSRDEGLSYLVMMFCLHRWLFRDGWKGTVTSYEESRVDEIDNPDSLFEKARIVLRRLPLWMMPDGFNWQSHDLSMRLVNPANGAVITGEVGKNTGRGGRSSFFFADEAAFYKDPSSVEASLSGNTEFILWGSTVAATGMGNWFAQKRHGDQLRPDQIYTLHYRDNPVRTAEWIADKKRSISALTWELEYEINYGAAVEGICIPAAWVQSAQKLKQYEPSLVHPDAKMRKRMLQWQRKRVGGLDVGAGGSGKSIYIDRAGPMVSVPEVRSDPNTTGTALWAIDLARKRYAYALNYDAPGCGIGVTSTLSDNEKTEGIVVTGINTGLPASDMEWPDGETSADKCLNLRAEGWMLARCRFERTHEHVTYREWQEACKKRPGLPRPQDAVEHPLDDLVSLGLDKESMILASQLSLPKWTYANKNKRKLESKEDMRKRGISSPDYADSYVLTELAPTDEEAAGVFKRPWFRMWPNGKPLPAFLYVVVVVRTAFDDGEEKVSTSPTPGDDAYSDPRNRAKYDTRDRMEARSVGPVSMGVYGVFNLKSYFDDRERQDMGLLPDQRHAALLCDFWTERVSYTEAVERIREAYRQRWGGSPVLPGADQPRRPVPLIGGTVEGDPPTGIRPELVLVDEGGSDKLSLRVSLERWKVPSWPFGSEYSPTMRAHQASVLVERGGLFVPESSRENREGKPRDWVEPMMRMACSYSGESSVTNPGAVDQMTAAMLHLRYKNLLRDEPKKVGYPDTDERRERDEAEAEEIHRHERKQGKSFYGA